MRSAIARRIVGHLTPTRPPGSDLSVPVPPRYDPAELHGIIPQDVRQPYDVREVIARIVDGSRTR